MTTSDIDQALRVLNGEPLYEHSAHNPTTFRCALSFPQATAAGPVYFPEDDFGGLLREKIPLPKGAGRPIGWRWKECNH